MNICFPIDYPKADGVITFDRLTNVAFSATPPSSVPNFVHRGLALRAFFNSVLTLEEL